MSHAPDSLTQSELLRLVAVVQRDGTHAVSRRLGIARATVASLVLGRAKRGSIALAASAIRSGALDRVSP